MPLYLDEIWLNETSPDNTKKIHKMFQGVLSGASGFPEGDRKSTRLNSSHIQKSRMPSSA